MLSVKEGLVWCPKYADVKLRPCPKPPVKKLIFDEIVQILAQDGRHFGIANETRVDVNWLLNCLSTLMPNHAIFQKSYYP